MNGKQMLAIMNNIGAGADHFAHVFCPYDAPFEWRLVWPNEPDKVDQLMAEGFTPCGTISTRLKNGVMIILRHKVPDWAPDCEVRQKAVEAAADALGQKMTEDSGVPVFRQE